MSFADMVAKLQPAVVNISTTQRVTMNANPFAGTPFEQFGGGSQPAAAPAPAPAPAVVTTEAAPAKAEGKREGRDGRGRDGRGRRDGGTHGARASDEKSSWGAPWALEARWLGWHS